MRIFVFLCLFFCCSTAATAQCRIGSGPDMGDGVPYCSETEPEAESSSHEIASPGEWHRYAAAVAWGVSEGKNVYTGVEKYENEQSARYAALAHCEAEHWENCVVAASISNGVVVIASDREGGLRSRIDASARKGVKAILDVCRKSKTTCKIEDVFDGTPEYY